MKRPQFSLSTILLLMALIATAMGWYRTHVAWMRSQQRVVQQEAALKKLEKRALQMNEDRSYILSAFSQEYHHRIDIEKKLGELTQENLRLRHQHSTEETPVKAPAVE